MSDFAKLQGEHAQLIKLADELLCLMAQNAPASRMQLLLVREALASGLIRHLHEEDRAVYPHLLRTGTASQRQALNSLRDQTGNLCDAFEQHMLRWTASRIQADWNGYCRECSSLLDALRQRVLCEDEHLYSVGTEINAAFALAAAR